MPDNYPTPGQFPAVETTHGQCGHTHARVGVWVWVGGTHMQGWVSVLKSGEIPDQSRLVMEH